MKNNNPLAQSIKIVPFRMEYLQDYYREFGEEITRYQWPDPFETIEDARELLQGFLEEAEQGEMLLLAVLSGDGEFLGSAEVHGLSEDTPEVGVWIKTSAWGQGYGYTALKAALEEACKTYGKTQFFYEADTRNTGSMKLLKKFEDAYDIEELETEDMVTDSGNELRMQGFVLKKK